MNQITIPFFHDFTQIFSKKRTEASVVIACLGRNGLKSDCCSDSIIKVKTGLSEDSIQKCFKRLTKEGIFIPDEDRKKERWGRINFNDNFKNNYKNILENYSNIHRNSFTCTVKKLNKEQSKIFLEGDDKRQYIAFCLNNHSTAFYLPIGIKIIFSGSLINCENNITTVWMDDKTIECYEPTPTNNGESK
jgi:predicted transcriptional regulator